MLRIAGGLLATGTSQRSLRRQISESGRGIGGDILKAASTLFSEAQESTSMIALIAARDFGDPRIIKGKRLEMRYPFGSQALRVEIAQTLTAIQTEEARDVIARLKEMEKDDRVLKAFDEPLVSSEGLSFSLDTNLRGGKAFDAKDDEETLTETGGAEAEKDGAGESPGPSQEKREADSKPEAAPAEGTAGEPKKEEKKPEGDKAGKAAGPGAGQEAAGEALEGAEIREEDVESEEILEREPDVAVTEGAEPEQAAEEEAAADGEAAEEEEGEEVEDEEQEEGEPGAARISVPPPLPPAEESAEQDEEGAVGPAVTIPPGPMPPQKKVEKKAEKKDYSVLFFTAIGIVLLGAIIGYGVIKLGKDGSGQEQKGKEGTSQGAGDHEKGLEKAGGGSGIEKGTEEHQGAPVSHIISAQVTASSEHPKYPASNVIDGDPGTVWQEEKTRKPFGEWIKLSFESQVTVTKLGIVSGYDFIDAEGKDYYPLNCRLKEAELIFSTGNTMKIYLDDTRTIQYVTINPPRETSVVRMTVFDVYKGSWFFDNAIGEVEVWGYEENEEHADEEIGEVEVKQGAAGDEAEEGEEGGP